MCTPGDDQILVAGTAVGSLVLFDLQDFESAPVYKNLFDYESLLMQQNQVDQDDLNPQKALKKLKQKYRVLGPIFATDALPNNQHVSPITRLTFVSKHGSSPATIAAMDELGVISSWSVIELSPHLADKAGVADLNLNIGGRYKLLENFQENMMFMPEVFDNANGFADIAQSMDLEFDPIDSNVFYFSTSGSLYRCNRRVSDVPTKLSTEDLGAPTSISMSDSKYLLVGFSCGSVA